jgi:hypothetical protein
MNKYEIDKKEDRLYNSGGLGIRYAEKNSIGRRGN